MAAEDEDRNESDQAPAASPTDRSADEPDDSETSAAASAAAPAPDDDGPAADDDGDDDEPDTSSAAASPAAPGPSRARRLWTVAIVAAVLLAVDLWSKQWAWDHLREGATEVVIDGWVYFEFGFNTGSAFSLLRDASWSRLLFIGITFLALVYMGHLARTLPTRFGSAFIAIAMVASGALGNLHDRFLRTMMIGDQERYGVVDFIKVYYWKGKPWPTFNVADVALVAGVLLLLLFLLRHGDVLDAEAKARAQAKARG